MGDGGLVQAFGDACLGHGATYAACSGLAPPDAAGASACYACLFTEEDASTYGVVVNAIAPVVDYGGCIGAVDPSEAGASCAKLSDDAYRCAEYACRPSCPVTDDPSLAAFQACLNEAFSGGCAGYALRALACTFAEQGDGGTPVARVCYGGTTREDHYLAAAQYFCAAGDD
jgi:hypothetical protein